MIPARALVLPPSRPAPARAARPCWCRPCWWASSWTCASRESPPDRYFILRRAALRNGDEVWAIRDDTLLTVVPVRVLQRSDDDVFVTGALEAGQPIVVGGIQVVTEGMIVRSASGRENP